MHPAGYGRDVVGSAPSSWQPQQLGPPAMHRLRPTVRGNTVTAVHRADELRVGRAALLSDRGVGYTRTDTGRARLRQARPVMLDSARDHFLSHLTPESRPAVTDLFTACSTGAPSETWSRPGWPAAAPLARRAG